MTTEKTAKAATREPDIQTIPPLPVEKRCEAEWRNSPQIRAEYSCLQAYTAATKAFETGRTQVLSRDPGADEPKNPAQPVGALSIEERCKREWNLNPDVREDFSSFEAFIAAERAISTGRARIIGNTS